MTQTLAARIAELRTLPAGELGHRYRDAHGGKAAISNNRGFLRRRLAYRIQESELGGLSVAVRRRLDELKRSLDLTKNPLSRAGARQERLPAHAGRTPCARPRGLRSIGLRDRRLPPSGTILERAYRGETLLVKVLDKGFECRGRVFRTLTALAGDVTGSHWNGFHFFGLV